MLKRIIFFALLLIPNFTWAFPEESDLSSLGSRIQKSAKHWLEEVRLHGETASINQAFYQDAERGLVDILGPMNQEGFHLEALLKKTIALPYYQNAINHINLKPENGYAIAEKLWKDLESSHDFKTLTTHLKITYQAYEKSVSGLTWEQKFTRMPATIRSREDWYAYKHFFPHNLAYYDDLTDSPLETRDAFQHRLSHWVAVHQTGLERDFLNENSFNPALDLKSWYRNMTLEAGFPLAPSILARLANDPSYRIKIGTKIEQDPRLFDLLFFYKSAYVPHSDLEVYYPILVRTQKRYVIDTELRDKPFFFLKDLKTQIQIATAQPPAEIENSFAYWFMQASEKRSDQLSTLEVDQLTHLAESFLASQNLTGNSHEYLEKFIKLIKTTPVMTCSDEGTH